MKIIATTDGSVRSLSVFPHISAFAAATGAKMTFLRVVNPLKDVERRRGIPLHIAAQPVIDHVRNDLQTLIDSFGIPGESAVAIQQEGERTHDAILRVAQETGAKMVAIASRGSGAVRHALLGSVALGVVGCSTLPVFTAGPLIQAPHRNRSYRLLAATDGSAASEQIFEALRPFLRAPGLSVTLLRVYVPTAGDRGDRIELADCRQQVKEIRDRFLPPTARGRVVKASGLHLAEHVILRQAEQLSVNAIAMSTHGHSARHHLIAGSTALAVLAHSSVPVILARSSPASKRSLSGVAV